MIWYGVLFLCAAAIACCIEVFLMEEEEQRD